MEKEKPFINLFPIRYWHKRGKYNPLRFILGERYLSKKVPSKLFDPGDIEIIPNKDDDRVKAQLLTRYINRHG